MCLSTVLRGKEKKAVLAKLKETIVVWKVLTKPGLDCGLGYRVNHYRTDCQGFSVFAGEVKFKQSLIGRVGQSSYRGGGHFWLTYAGVKDWNHFGGEKIVQCTIKKSDINTIGFQNNHPVVVVKAATFPKYIGKRKVKK